MSDIDLKAYSQQLSYMTYDFNLDNDFDIKPIAKSEDHFRKWVVDYPFYANIRKEEVFCMAQSKADIRIIEPAAKISGSMDDSWFCSGSEKNQNHLDKPKNRGQSSKNNVEIDGILLPGLKLGVEFDQKVIHGEFYKPAVNLRKAFDILEEKIRDIIQESAGRRILITADHGATARAKWTETKKKYNFAESDHEGRCCSISSKDDYTDTLDYIVYEDEGKPGKTR